MLHGGEKRQKGGGVNVLDIITRYICLQLCVSLQGWTIIYFKFSYYAFGGGKSS